MQARRGWILLDVLMGMMIVAILGSILAAAAEMHQRVRQHLDDSQTATREAESALLKMQSHQMLPENYPKNPPKNPPEKPPEKPTENPTVGNGGQLIFKQLQNSPQTPGMKWIEVRATVHARTATVIGLVPQTALGEK